MKADGQQTENSEWVCGEMVSVGIARFWAEGVEISASGRRGRKI